MHEDERRRIIAQKLFDLANLEAGVVVFGELAGRNGVRSELVMLGLTIFALLYGIGYFLITKENL